VQALSLYIQDIAGDSLSNFAKIVLKMFAQACDDEPRPHIHLAGKRGLRIPTFGFVPYLTIYAVAIPAIVSDRNAIHIDELKAPEQFIVFRYLNRLPANGDID
jgi:hypothetical protein